MTTIHFDNTITHAPTRRSRAHSVDDGIYNIRERSRAPSLDRRRTATSDLNASDDDPGLRRSGDYKTRQTYHGRTLLYLAYQSIGVIYGDIGTSPLYVYSSTFTEPPNRDDLIGALSIIIWSLSLMVTLKYVLIILRADNDGEGGTFSTYSLLSRYVSGFSSLLLFSTVRNESSHACAANSSISPIATRVKPLSSR